MKSKLLILAGLGAGFLGGWLTPALEAQDENILTLPSSVRSQGMGNAYSAVGKDVTALFGNPGGLGFARRYEALFLYEKGFQSLRQHNVGLVIPFGQFTAANVDRFGSLGVAFGMLDYGNFEARDRNGVRVGDYDADENALTLAYGHRFLEWVSIGVKGKMYKRTIDHQKNSGWAYDVGGLFGKKTWPVHAAVTGFNVNGQTTFVQQDEDLPQSIVYGLAYNVDRGKLTLAADLAQPQEGGLKPRAGAEYWINPIYALRAGYDSRIESGVGASVGFGIRIEEFEVRFFPIEQVMIDYAFTPGDELSNGHQLSLALRLSIP